MNTFYVCVCVCVCVCVYVCVFVHCVCVVCVICVHVCVQRVRNIYFKHLLNLSFFGHKQCPHDL